MIINAPRGTVDITPEQIYQWHYIEAKIRRIMDIFRYKEIRTPIFEKTELFIRSVGEGTDIVTKEMYTFNDKGGRSITLRPEGTASVVRSHIERGGHSQNSLEKLYYISPMFRYERPQAGRLRQHHQFGVEAIGAAGAEIDIEVIALAMQFFKGLGLKDILLKINSVGCSECRKEYIAQLKQFIEAKRSELCGDCRNRFETNPLRILDCKNEKCREELENSPSIPDFLCEVCREHFERVKKGLSAISVNYKEDSRLVRGLDYYTRTTFEVVAQGIGAQDSIAGGGRYDNLVEQLGGPPTPAVGFGAGIERLIATLNKAGIQVPHKEQFTVFFALLDDKSRDLSLPILYDCRSRGIHSEMDFFSRSLKSQLKLADRLGAGCAVIIGEDEINKSKALIRDFVTKEQIEISFSDIPDYLNTKYINRGAV